MKNIETDVLVTGAGLAGAAAALAAKNSGKKVMVLSRGAGASAMSSGALDIAADPIAATGRPEKWSQDCGKNIDDLLIRNPGHPYALIGSSPAKILEEIKCAMALVFPGQDGFIVGDVLKSQFVFNQIGTFKQTSFTQTHILNLDDLKGAGSVLLLNFSGLSDFDPEFFAKNFLHWTGQLGEKPGLIHSEISGSGLRDKSSLELARWIDENPEQALEALVKAIKSNKAGLVIMPALFPAPRRKDLISRIEKDAQVKFRELLSLPPSVPGKRLAQYLESRLHKEGIGTYPGAAVGFKAEGKRICSLLVEDNSGRIEISSRAFVLAAGSFLAGGIDKHDEFKEKLFGLDLFCNGGPLSKIFTEKLTSAVITRPHPVFSVGLKTDDKMRVFNRNGEQALENLFAAGSILTGADYLYNGTGAGVALSSGARAGKTISN